jgi:Flp pilus assembly pilin Flp
MTARRLASDQSGATIIEFAIILAPLMIVILGFMELGYQSYVRSVLQGTLNDVARTATVENPNLGDSELPLETRIQNRVEERMRPLVASGTYDFDISNYQDFAGVAQPEALVTDVNKHGKYDAGDCWEDSNPNGTFDLDGARSGVGGADDVVVYEVTLSVPHLLPIGGFLGVSDDFDASAKTMSRRQPFAQQRHVEVAC